MICTAHQILCGLSYQEEWVGWGVRRVGVKERVWLAKPEAKVIPWKTQAYLRG